jgi:hypothetical protein
MPSRLRRYLRLLLLGGTLSVSLLIVGLWCFSYMMPGCVYRRALSRRNDILIVSDSKVMAIGVWGGSPLDLQWLFGVRRGEVSIGVCLERDPNGRKTAPPSFKWSLGRFAYSQSPPVRPRRPSMLHEVRFPLWAALVFFGAYPTARIMNWLRGRRRSFSRECCRNCGYCLIGNVSGVCPECGGPIRVTQAVKAR